MISFNVLMATALLSGLLQPANELEELENPAAQWMGTCDRDNESATPAQELALARATLDRISRGNIREIVPTVLYDAVYHRRGSATPMEEVLHTLSDIGTTSPPLVAGRHLAIPGGVAAHVTMFWPRERDTDHMLVMFSFRGHCIAAIHEVTEHHTE